MTVASTPDELALFNSVTCHATALWNRTQGMEGRSTDPTLFSAMLFKRLWSNHLGYASLCVNNHDLEADLILRSGIEASICLPANFHLREKFVLLMHGDAIYTLKGQIKMWREEGASDLVKHSEATLRDLQARLPDGIKPDRLQWNELAALGEAPHLYGWHRMLSGVSSHVTGLSVLGSIEAVDGSSRTRELGPLQRKMHLMMMAGATLTGCLRHGGILNDQQSCAESVELIAALGNLSWDWPGVTRERPDAR